MPNAVMVLDHSTWNADQTTDDCDEERRGRYDMIRTTGVATNDASCRAPKARAPTTGSPSFERAPRPAHHDPFVTTVDTACLGYPTLTPRPRRRPGELDVSLWLLRRQEVASRSLRNGPP